MDIRRKLTFYYDLGSEELKYIVSHLSFAVFVQLTVIEQACNNSIYKYHQCDCDAHCILIVLFNGGGLLLSKQVLSQ